MVLVLIVELEPFMGLELVAVGLRFVVELDDSDGGVMFEKTKLVIFMVPPLSTTFMTCVPLGKGVELKSKNDWEFGEGVLVLYTPTWLSSRKNMIFAIGELPLHDPYISTDVPKISSEQHNIPRQDSTHQ